MLCTERLLAWHGCNAVWADACCRLRATGWSRRSTSTAAARRAAASSDSRPTSASSAACCQPSTSAAVTMACWTRCGRGSGRLARSVAWGQGSCGGWLWKECMPLDQDQGLLHLGL
eukprot:365305-Chlamydomonas_euryale.AAC.1